MNIKNLTLLTITLLCLVGCSSNRKGGDVTITISAPIEPILRDMERNPTLYIHIKKNKPNSKVDVNSVKISFEASSALKDIARVSLLTSNEQSGQNQILAATSTITDTIELRPHYSLEKESDTLIVSLLLKEITDLRHKLSIGCLEVETTQGVVHFDAPTFYTFRYGVAIHEQLYQKDNRARYPALGVTNEGTLIAAYDTRSNSLDRIQGVAIKRSSARGIDWKPILRVLDMGEDDIRSQRYTGVTNANIIIDKSTGELFIFGLLTNGILDADTGLWIENRESEDTKYKGQLLLTTSTDDGITWSAARNITELVKQANWRHFSTSPGTGIMLTDGTLVAPAQGEDSSGKTFTTIIYSRDKGKTWHVASIASYNTNLGAVAQLADGSLMLNVSNSDRPTGDDVHYRQVYISKDLGKHWSEHPSSGKELADYKLGASLLNHYYTDKESGERKSVLLFLNAASSSEQNFITLRASFDDGDSWGKEHSILIDQIGGGSFSSLASVDDENIGIVYEGQRADIIFQLIPLADILSL